MSLTRELSSRNSAKEGETAHLENAGNITSDVGGNCPQNRFRPPRLTAPLPGTDRAHRVLADLELGCVRRCSLRRRIWRDSYPSTTAKTGIRTPARCVALFGWDTELHHLLACCGANRRRCG